MPRTLHIPSLRVTVGILTAITAAAALRFASNSAASRSAAGPRPAVPKSFQELRTFSVEELRSVDVARMNLLCAEGLHGSERLDVNRCMEQLDRWAAKAKEAETAYLPGFFRDPRRYDSSLATFKTVTMALTLKEEFGVGYNMELVRSGALADISSQRFFSNSGDVFLHGILSDGKGTCSSLPVLMVAVGRRCGYPLHLVATKGHLFFRWDDGKERINFEVATRGVDSKPDAHYRRWPYPSTDEEVRAEGYLTNLAPVGELAVFAQIRAACLQANGRYGEAAGAYGIASRATPGSGRLRYLAATPTQRPHP